MGREFIDRKAFYEGIDNRFCKPCQAEGKDYNGVACRACWVDDMRCEVDDFPAIDVCAQIVWERDTAIKQLEEHGIPFCGVAPDVVKVVRCKECMDADYVDGTLYCFRWSRNADDDGYCHEGVQRAERSDAP
jgi:hypothetical protein